MLLANETEREGKKRSEKKSKKNELYLFHFISTTFDRDLHKIYYNVWSDIAKNFILLHLFRSFCFIFLNINTQNNTKRLGFISATNFLCVLFHFMEK